MNRVQSIEARIAIVIPWNTQMLMIQINIFSPIRWVRVCGTKTDLR